MIAQRSLVIGLLLAATWGLGFALWRMSARHPQDMVPRAHADRPYQETSSEQRNRNVSQPPDSQPQEDAYVRTRQQMVQHQLADRDITDKRVLEVMSQVPRHRFVPESAVSRAYQDGPLPIGHGQTISQPYIVAIMTQLARPRESSVALDIGTGSGYQAAVLSRLCDKVYSIEIVEPLAKSARERLAELGYRNVTVRHGDGYRGWPEHAPFDLIIVAAAPDHVPQPLIDQLKPGGRLVVPVGKYYQSLLLIEKLADGSVRQREVIPVAFVPMTGEAQKRNRE